jgi:hypothetical protein
MNELAGEHGSTSPEAPSHSTELQECWLLVELWREVRYLPTHLPAGGSKPRKRRISRARDWTLLRIYRRLTLSVRQPPRLLILDKFKSGPSL